MKKKGGKQFELLDEMEENWSVSLFYCFVIKDLVFLNEGKFTLSSIQVSLVLFRIQLYWAENVSQTREKFEKNDRCDRKNDQYLSS